MTATYPYREVFELTEQALIQYGSRFLALDRIRSALDYYKNVSQRELTDDRGFALLRDIVFYSGFRAATVTARLGVIKHWLPTWQTVADYCDEHVSRMMSDPTMIRNERKIRACIRNAKVIRDIVAEHGSFGDYISAFSAECSFENLLLLKEELEARFQYLGGVTVYHFLTELGLRVLKPDRVICRFFHRLGLIEREDQLLKTVLQGRKFADATSLPIRYIDIVFVAYGQVQTLDFGIERGICLKSPRCVECGVKSFCHWWQTSQKGVSAIQ